MTEEVANCFYRISAKALIWSDSRDKFLLALEDNGKWELPGGGIDWNESPQDSIRRELKEEMGLTVKSISGTPRQFLTFQNAKGLWRSNVIYETTVENLNFTKSEECIEIKFVSPEEALALEVFPNVHIFANQLKAETLH